ncbi:MAG: helix-turn-helix domain-containing protein [Desulfobacula sp.]|nr:helix-turn-helix domain-containing protein [Desulfobacula sp.]
MNNLRKKREVLGFTLKEVAKKIDVHLGTISAWERNKKEPRPKNKIKLAELYNCATEELFIDISENDLFKSADTIDKNSDFPDSPFAKFIGKLELGNDQIDCYVLDTKERVISMGTTVKALAKTKSADLAEYIGVKALKPYINKELVLAETVEFNIPGTHYKGRGLKAEIFLDICNAYVMAFSDGALKTSKQQEIAIRSSILLASCAKVGLIALIDEATGYQYERQESALQLKLKAFVADEMRGWEKTFPDELWEQFGRLTSWKGSLHSRPKWWGKLVMELIYNALDSDVSSYLKENKPPPTHKKNYHQWLSEHYGLKQLVTHIYEIIGMAKTCTTIKELQQQVAHHYKNIPLQLDLFNLK